ncbi:redoxin domain-containing protein [Aurantiacibacter sp. D1-12]|uniref:redoxin domain-containing protein n=1 Tax=Aurantiacibacter sp. D1-12 TaxID=2993658 RepID=UPI00237D3136|nr:redoxin domain-containing protein [Aurantiacibacter sp. D1-12]MDE1466406.1 redoxin domain-containing protein [Aurantiacibacter sp. D1-12]
MADHRPSYDISAPSIRPYVQELWPGGLATPFDTKDEEGRSLNLADDHLSGRFILLALLSDPHATQTAALLESLAGLETRLDAANATVIAVSASSDAAQNKAMKRAAGFPWPVVCDSPGGIFASYGLHKGTDRTARLVVVTPYRQIRTWFDLKEDADATLRVVMDLLENAQAVEEMRWSPPHAPVLIVPNVLSPEECAKLVESVETDTPFMVRRPQPGEIAGNYKMPVYEHHRQDRVDMVIKDKNTLAFLDERVFGRVAPMIKKAFAFDVTRREDLHIARYVGRREGIEMGHRDNTSPAGAHRRFALSMSLNDDYEGGGVAFKEFSPKGYRVPAGTAMVFSSSLLHEVQETTSGVRYNLISHLFNDQALAR